MHKPISHSRRRQRRRSRSQSDLHIIHHAFAEHLRALGYAKLTIGWYQNRLRRIAEWLSRRDRRLADIRFNDVAQLVTRLGRCGFHTRKMNRAALHCWLRFRGLKLEVATSKTAKPWQHWLNRYDQFLVADCGFAPNTRVYRRRYARCFLAAQFRSRPVRWAKLQAADIWRFAEQFYRRVRPSSANVMLCSLRSFLRFVHLQGACGLQLAQAVPHVANYGRRRATEVFSEAQRRQFLGAFSQTDPRGQRDYAIALCLIDLGLRADEVTRLRLSDVTWQPPSLVVPATKTDRHRQLPLPPHVVAALRRYVRHARPTTSTEHLFVRHRSFVGQPFSLSGLRQAMRRTFHRCGLPRAWTGTHRLRHSFAARLYARGADLKQIADLLGHRHLDTSNRYVHVGPESLRPLVQPWPL